MYNKEHVIYKDKLYWVYRKVKQSQIKEGYIQDIKEFWFCDLVIKNRYNNDDMFLFIKEIPDAELVVD